MSDVEMRNIDYNSKELTEPKPHKTDKSMYFNYKPVE